MFEELANPTPPDVSNALLTERAFVRARQELLGNDKFKSLPHERLTEKLVAVIRGIVEAGQRHEDAVVRYAVFTLTHARATS